MRLDEDRLFLKAVQHMYTHRSEEDLVMDAPKTSNWLEMRQWAKHRKKVQDKDAGDPSGDE